MFFMSWSKLKSLQSLIYLLVAWTKQQTPVVLSLCSKAPGVTIKRCWELCDAKGWLALPPGTLQSYFQPCKMITRNISMMFTGISDAERD